MCGMHMCIYIYVYIYNYIYSYIYIYIGFKPSVSRGKLAQRSLWNRQRKLTCFKPFLTWILRKGSGTYYKKKYKILMLHILHVPIWSYLIYWNSETVWMVRGRKNGPVLGPQTRVNRGLWPGKCSSVQAKNIWESCSCVNYLRWLRCLSGMQPEANPSKSIPDPLR